MSDPSLDAADKLLDKLRDWMIEAINVATGYEQIIIAAGYAGFLTVWTQTAPHLPKLAVLWSGGLIATSLLVFVAFHIFSICVRSLGMLRMGKELMKHKSPQDQLAAMVEQQKRNGREAGIVLVVWPFAFVTSVVTGLAAAALIVGACFAGVIASAAP